MDRETREELESLRAETLAYSAIIGSLCRRLAASDPVLKDIVSKAFEDAARLVMILNDSASPSSATAHLVPALKVVDDIRSIVESGHNQPKHGI